MKRRIITRRRFLKTAALGAAAVTVQPILSTRKLYAANPGIPGRFVVIINCLGGNDGLNTCIPTHLDAYESRRPNINLVNPANLPAGQSLYDLDGNYKLHYALQNMGSIWDAGDMHVVQKVSYPNPNQSHFTSQDIFSHGVRNEADLDGRGWLGRFADEYCASPVEPLGVISVGAGRRRDFESDTTSPLILNNVGTFSINQDNERFQDGALRNMVVEDTLNAESGPTTEPGFSIFQTSKQAFELVDRVQAGTADWVDPGTYPSTTLGSRMRTISQLLEGIDEFKTRVFYTAFGGFDTHSAQQTNGNNSRHEQLMEQLDGAIGAFRDDMIAKGMWNNACVVVISEFGRRTFENGSEGTDHGHGNCFFVASGRVKGKFDAGSGMTGALVSTDISDNNVVPFQYDFRDIYGQVIQNHLGLSPTPLFPDPGYVPAVNDLNII